MPSVLLVAHEARLTHAGFLAAPSPLLPSGVGSHVNAPPSAPAAPVRGLVACLQALAGPLLCDGVLSGVWRDSDPLSWEFRARGPSVLVWLLPAPPDTRRLTGWGWVLTYRDQM